MKPWEEKKWLETAIPLDWGLTLYEDYAKHIVNLIYTMLFDKESKKKRHTLIKIIANLRLAYDLGVPLRYSRHNNNYTNVSKNYGIGRVVSKTVMDKLLEEDVIAQRMKGFIHYNPKGDIDKNRQTRIWPTPNLIGIFRPIQPEDVIKEPPRLIQLKKRLTRAEKKNKKKAKQIDYDELAEDVLIMKEQLRLHHNLLEKSNITLEIPTGMIIKKKSKERLENVILRQQLHSVWRKLQKTGIDYYDNDIDNNIVFTMLDIQDSNNKYKGIEEALYTTTGTVCVRLCYHWTIRSFITTFNLGGRYYNIAWGHMGKDLRQHLKINFEPVCEPDFQGLHPNQIYHLNNMDFHGDVYTCGDAPRKLYKMTLLMIINSRPTESPYEAVKGFFFEEKLYKKYPDCLKKKVLQPIIDDVFKTHHRIADYFFSDIGIKLQNIDSQITSNILDHFISRGIVCLPVHDSYIVQQKHKEELIQVMSDEYEKVMKFKPTIT